MRAISESMVLRAVSTPKASPRVSEYALACTKEAAAPVPVMAWTSFIDSMISLSIFIDSRGPRDSKTLKRALNIGVPSPDPVRENDDVAREVDGTGDEVSS